MLNLFIVKAHYIPKNYFIMMAGIIMLEFQDYSQLLSNCFRPENFNYMHYGFLNYFPFLDLGSNCEVAPVFVFWFRRRFHQYENALQSFQLLITLFSAFSMLVLQSAHNQERVSLIFAFSSLTLRYLQGNTAVLMLYDL